MGIAPERDDVECYLRSVAHDEVADVNNATVLYARRTGSALPAAPGRQDLWEASASGTGRQTLEWEVRSGRWAVVVMNADAARGVAARVSIAARSDLLLWIGLGRLAGAVIAAGTAAALLVAGIRMSSTNGRATRTAARTQASVAAGTQASVAAGTQPSGEAPSASRTRRSTRTPSCGPSRSSPTRRRRAPYFAAGARGALRMTQTTPRRSVAACLAPLAFAP